MALAEIHGAAHATHIAGLIATPFKAVWEFLIDLGENSSRGQKIQQLNSLTDEQLAARGLNRQDVVNKIFRDCI